jgi:hypothetical protein
MTEEKLQKANRLHTEIVDIERAIDRIENRGTGQGCSGYSLPELDHLPDEVIKSLRTQAMNRLRRELKARQDEFGKMWYERISRSNGGGHRSHE